MAKRWNSVAALGLLVSVAYFPAIPDSAVAIRWAVLSIGIPLMLFQITPRMTAGHCLGLAIVLYSALSLAWGPNPFDGINAVWQLLLLAAAFCIGAEQDDLEPVYTGMAIGVSVSGFLGIVQLLGYGPIAAANVPAGLFGNRNSMAEIGALLLVAALAMRKWWLVPGTALAALLPLSRGVMAALSVAGLAWLWPRSRILTVALGLLLAVGASIGFEIDSTKPGNAISERIAIWSDTADGLTWPGRGVGSFYREYPQFASRFDTLVTRPFHAHNDYLELAFETGPCLILFMALVLVALQAPLGTERLILLAVLVESCFAFPLHLPATGLLAALVLGRLCGARRVLRDDVDFSGDLLLARSPLGSHA